MITREQLERMKEKVREYREYGSIGNYERARDSFWENSDALLAAAELGLRAVETWRASLPEGTKWVAMDENGIWCCFSEERPVQECVYPGKGFWFSENGCDECGPPPFHTPGANWKDTLTEITK